jgi:hypothetical protein
VKFREQAVQQMGDGHQGPREGRGGPVDGVIAAQSTHLDRHDHGVNHVAQVGRQGVQEGSPGLQSVRTGS